MKERDYIYATDLAKVRIMLAVLREIVPGDVNPRISEVEYRGVADTLQRWQHALLQGLKQPSE